MLNLAISAAVQDHQTLGALVEQSISTAPFNCTVYALFDSQECFRLSLVKILRHFSFCFSRVLTWFCGLADLLVAIFPMLKLTVGAAIRDSFTL